MLTKTKVSVPFVMVIQWELPASRDSSRTALGKQTLTAYGFSIGGLDYHLLLLAADVG